MFSGIIKEVGEVISNTKKDGYTELIVNIKNFATGAELGESIAHNGVCLTLAEVNGTFARYDLLEETCNKTILGNVKPGKKLNLERSLKLGDKVDGHLVYGHVDEVASILQIQSTPAATRITISPTPAFMRYIVPQGAVAIDGVSLTIASFNSQSFTVSLVPYTLEHTAFHANVVGDKVNVEADMLAKYAQKQL